MTTKTDAGGRAAIFHEFETHLMGDEKPSQYFDGLLNAGSFPDAFPFSMLSDLVGVEQSPAHHPEGDVWRHTMLVTDNAALLKSQSKAPRELMWAALLHDVGKKETTKRRGGRITAYDHDKAGRALAERFIRECGQNETFARKVGALVRWHMQALYAARHLPYFNPRGMRAETDLDEVALLCLCDRLGRGPVTAQGLEKERREIETFIQKSRRTG
ncbi:MAG: HDIG domain-containing metalloprotein [Bacillota bacterium]